MQKENLTDTLANYKKQFYDGLVRELLSSGNEMILFKTPGYSVFFTVDGKLVPGYLLGAKILNESATPSSSNNNSNSAGFRSLNYGGYVPSNRSSTTIVAPIVVNWKFRHDPLNPLHQLTARGKTYFVDAQPVVFETLPVASTTTMSSSSAAGASVAAPNIEVIIAIQKTNNTKSATGGAAAAATTEEQPAFRIEDDSDEEHLPQSSDSTLVIANCNFLVGKIISRAKKPTCKVVIESTREEKIVPVKDCWRIDSVFEGPPPDRKKRVREMLERASNYRLEDYKPAAEATQVLQSSVSLTSRRTGEQMTVQQVLQSFIRPS